MGVYLAMTDLELRHCAKLPTACAWLSCHLSSGDRGLSNFPTHIPKHSLLCIDDSLLPQEHNPKIIAQQVLSLSEKFSLNGIILDFQRPYCRELHTLAQMLMESLPCPVAVTEPYGTTWNGAVFLPPIPPTQQISQYLSPFTGRDIWLELSCEPISIALTQNGCIPAEGVFQKPIWKDNTLHCHYHIDLTEDAAIFTLFRTWEDNLALAEDCRQYGVTNAVGLYQEISSICPLRDIE